MGKLIGKDKHTVNVQNQPHRNMISKQAIVRRGEYKRRILAIHLKLRDQQLKASTYKQRLLLKKDLVVISRQKSLIDKHTKKRKESKHNAKDQITREENKRRQGKKDLQNPIQND